MECFRLSLSLGVVGISKIREDFRPPWRHNDGMAQPDISFGLARIGQIAVTVSDLDRAVPFYRDTLGMRHLFQVPNMAFFDCGGIRLMLGLPEKSGERFSSVIYY